MTEITNQFRQLTNHGTKLKQEFQQRISGYITAAFGLVAGLAWNDAIRSLIEYWFPVEQNNILAKFIYAVLITITLVIVTVYVIKLFQTKND